MSRPAANGYRAVAPGATCRVGFLLLPGFTLLGFATAVEALRETNRILQQPAYEWATLSPVAGDGVEASCGIRVPVDHVLPGGRRDPAWKEAASLPTLDMLFVCADAVVDAPPSAATAEWLQHLAREGCQLGAFGAGLTLLVAAGVTGERQCTTHWAVADWLRERYPGLRLSTRQMVVDRGLCTCAGAANVAHLFVYLVTTAHGRTVGERLADVIQFERGRVAPGAEGTSLPRAPLLPRQLQSAIHVMEGALETPLAPEAIAERAGVTPRHLQRLFRTHTGVPPATYYLNLRLRRARLLLLQTRLRVVEVATAVGFNSHSHFSRRYRERYGITPQTERARHSALASSDGAVTEPPPPPST